MDLVSALRAETGICCFVGAGGKKTTMYTLAHRLERAVVTATVRIPIFDDEVAEVVVTPNPQDAIATASAWPIGVVPEQEGTDRYRGYDPVVIDQLASDAVLLVKADGARMRRFKAPGPHEPRIPRSANTVVPIASAHVVGEPLDDRLVHRVDRVADVADVSAGAEITPDMVAQVLVDDAGGRKDVPADATFVPLINMVDGPEERGHGRAIASAILRMADVSHVVLAAMRESDPLVDVIDTPSSF